MLKIFSILLAISIAHGANINNNNVGRLGFGTNINNNNVGRFGVNVNNNNVGGRFGLLGKREDLNVTAFNQTHLVVRNNTGNYTVGGPLGSRMIQLMESNNVTNETVQHHNITVRQLLAAANLNNNNVGGLGLLGLGATNINNNNVGGLGLLGGANINNNNVGGLGLLGLGANLNNNNLGKRGDIIAEDEEAKLLNVSHVRSLTEEEAKMWNVTHNVTARQNINNNNVGGFGLFGGTNINNNNIGKREELNSTVNGTLLREALMMNTTHNLTARQNINNNNVGGGFGLFGTTNINNNNLGKREELNSTFNATELDEAKMINTTHSVKVDKILTTTMLEVWV